MASQAMEEVREDMDKWPEVTVVRLLADMEVPWEDTVDRREAMVVVVAVLEEVMVV